VTKKIWWHIIILEKENKKKMLGSSVSRNKYPQQTIRSSKGAPAN
jgi:hypothetical protein